MATFLRSAAIAAGAFFMARSVFRYIKEQQYTFQYKVVLITGASRGLGLVMARQLANEGARLSICARDKQELSEARRQLEAIGAEVLILEADLTQEGEAERVISQTVTQYGRLDCLINNAGAMVVGPLKSQTLNTFDQQLKLSFYAPLRLIDAALPHLRQVKGRILNISSIGGKISFPHLLSYTTGKFALTGFSEGLYTELKREGVLVTTACPGLMQTGSPRNVDVVGNQEEEYRWFKIGDSLPILAMHSETAAHKLLNAFRRGDPEYILTLPAKLASIAHGISPSLVMRVNELVSRFVLPEPIENTQAVKGFQTNYEHNRSPLTKSTDDAAARNNEYRNTNLN